ncbi:MAG: flagellar export chaperone FliS [Bdellovibrionales bacterium GWB1_55_8]|nr:MAG: flagellar export chaperone FliS [Bdellovibrionales bacterium GWB1_55_8]
MYGAKQYRQTQITTANRGQVLLMLYEAAIQNVRKASIAIDKKHVEAKGIAIGKAHDIINELVNTLDFEVGGNIAVELERLYNFMIEQLMKANLENSKEKLLAVEKLLGTLLEGWRGAVAQANKEGITK